MVWACPKCTYLNENNICEMCKYKRKENNDSMIIPDNLRQLMDLGFSESDVYIYYLE